jgi:hypothetical protein
VHYKFIAFQLLKGSIIPPFADLIRRIKISQFRLHQTRKKQDQEEMRFQGRNNHKSKNPIFQPIIPLVRVKPASDEADKSKFISFELKVRAGTGAGTPSYKKFMRTFEEGTPQEWMDVLTGLKEIWKQNTVNGPTDRAATIAAILKGDSRIAFDTALEDAREDEDGGPPDPMTLDHIEESLRAVTEIVFPFRALENQKQWMNRYMKKPHDLPTKSFVAAVSRINNYLPSFPKATNNSKYDEEELIGLMEFALPKSWRDAFDLKGFVPSEGDKAEFIDQCERIERNEIPINKDRDDKDDNNKNDKKSKFAKSQNGNKKNGHKNNPTTTDDFYCKKCGDNPTHNTDRCFILKRLAREKEASNGNGNDKAQAKPYSKRSFRKEINAMARRAGKHDGLDVMATALKREQKKTAKREKKLVAAKTAKKTAKKDPETDSSSDDSVNSVNMLEKPIPRKKAVKQKAQQVVFLMDTDSSDEDESVDMETSKATAEEKAFLQSIDKEENDQKGLSDIMDDKTN